MGWIFELNGIFIVLRAILGGKAGYIRVFHSCWTHLSCERPSPFAQIDQGEHREGAIGVLGQATIANLGKAPDALEGQERMLDLGTDTGLAPVGFFVRLSQWPAPVGPLVGEVLCFGSEVLELFAQLRTPVGAVAIEPGLLTVQQVGQLLAVMHVAGGDTRAVNQPALAVHADVQLHAKVPLVALPALVHLRVALARCVLGRGRRCDQRRIDNRAAGEFHSVGQQQLANLGKQHRANPVLLQQVAEIEQRGGIGHSLTAQVNSTEITERSDIVERVFAGLIAQVEPDGNAVHPQHPLHASGRATATGFRVVRFDQRTELSPRHQRLHARQKFRLAGGSPVHLESFRRRQCHLLHNQPLPVAFNTMTTQRGTCSVFPYVKNK